MAEPIIGGNWATTEPRYRKPSFLPSKGKLYKLTNLEIDTMDALLLLGRASTVSEIYNLLRNLYDEMDTIRKCLDRLTELGCVDKGVRKNPGISISLSDAKLPRTYRINEKGTEAFNESMDALEAMMMESNRRGIRRNRKRS